MPCCNVIHRGETTITELTDTTLILKKEETRTVLGPGFLDETIISAVLIFNRL